MSFHPQEKRINIFISLIEIVKKVVVTSKHIQGSVINCQNSAIFLNEGTHCMVSVLTLAPETTWVLLNYDEPSAVDTQCNQTRRLLGFKQQSERGGFV